MSNFDERSGYTPCGTPWGKWWQTIHEVFIEIDVPNGTKGKDVTCSFKTRHITVKINGETVIEGNLPFSIHPDDVVWTVEDRKMVRICLPKTDRSCVRVWKSLVVGQYEADPQVFDQMEQKVTMQRFQLEVS